MLSLCHSNAIKEQLKEQSKEDLAWLLPSQSQMQQASNHVSDFFNDLNQGQVSNQQALDILALVNQSSEMSSRAQARLSTKSMVSRYVKRNQKTIQKTCAEVKNTSLAGNMPLNLGIPAFDLSSFYLNNL